MIDGVDLSNNTVGEVVDLPSPRHGSLWPKMGLAETAACPNVTVRGVPPGNDQVIATTGICVVRFRI